MKLNTCSQVISLAKKLESESAKFYEELSRRYPQDADILLSFVKANGKNIVQIERVYYEVISDAIEGCFAFNVEPDEYTFEIELVEGASYSAALGKAIELEEKIMNFYSDAAEQSKSLMADIPRAFTLMAKKRIKRGLELRSLSARESSRDG